LHLERLDPAAIPEHISRRYFRSQRDWSHEWYSEMGTRETHWSAQGECTQEQTGSQQSRAERYDQEKPFTHPDPSLPMYALRRLYK
jgi:hypothetical protein